MWKSDKAGKFMDIWEWLVFWREVAELKVWLKAQENEEGMVHNCKDQNYLTLLFKEPFEDTFLGWGKLPSYRVEC